MAPARRPPRRLSRRLEEAAGGLPGAVLSDYGYGVGRRRIPSRRFARALPASAPILVDSRHGLHALPGRRRA